MAAMTVFSCGCARKGQKVETEQDIEVGDWPAIKLSREEVSFGPKGGTVTITCENYESWWINDVQIVGTEKYVHADPGANNEYRTLNAEGISAEIVGGNKVKITVSPSAAAGDWLLHMEAGDAFTEIRIKKEGR